jgi:hypothetical protein
MTSVGLYKITNILSELTYIGRSENISRRWREHKANLIKGTHRNKKLQEDFDFYGMECFEFEIIKECSLSELAYMELDEIYSYYPDVYNVVSWKDYLRHDIYNKAKKINCDIDIEIDYKDDGCKSPSNNSLNWALRLMLYGNEYYIHIVDDSYDDYDKYDYIRNEFIESNNHKMEVITYTVDKCEFVVLNEIKKVKKNITAWAENCTQSFLMQRKGVK